MAHGSRRIAAPRHLVKHWIASDLRFFRERDNFSLVRMGRIMCCSKHTVSNIEHARDGWNMNEVQAARLDAHVRLNDHFTRLVRYARTVHNPDRFADYTRYEAKAALIKTYRLSLFPGLFQTPEYARFVLTAARQVEDVEAAVEARMRRQEILMRPDPPQIWVLLDESILRRPIGDPTIMRGQLARMLEAADMPNVTVRVILESSGYYLGLDGAFDVLAQPHETRRISTQAAAGSSRTP